MLLALFIFMKNLKLQKKLQKPCRFFIQTSMSHFATTTADDGKTAAALRFFFIESTDLLERRVSGMKYDHDE